MDKVAGAFQALAGLLMLAFWITLASICSAGCDLGDGRALATVTCAAGDERLGVAFREPAKARTYLRGLGRRLRAGDGEAVREAADLVARITECLPSR